MATDITPPTHAHDEAAEREWQQLVNEGDLVRQSWVHEGLLIPLSELAAAWGCAPEALWLATTAGELLSLTVSHNRYYPAVFKSLSVDEVMDICRRLHGTDEAGQFIFWNKPHIALGGMTPEEALLTGNRNGVVQLADAWAQERGGNSTS